MMGENLTQALAIARETAVQTGQYLRQQWTQPRQQIQKGFRDFVTDADFAAQKQITNALQATFPTHGFLTEENDDTLPQEGDWLWVIDPIDGTSNYSRQLTLYSISIALTKAINGHLQTQVGVVYDPMSGELFSGIRGQGAWLGTAVSPQQTPLQISPINTLSESIISFDWAHGHQQRTQTIQLLTQIAPHVRTLRAFGSATLALAWVAAGRLEGYYNVWLKPWDVAAATLLIEEAGGKITTISGKNPWHIAQPATLATNGRIHPPLRHLLDQEDRDREGR